jgi:Na+(H+)/acetate symporter ActP
MTIVLYVLLTTALYYLFARATITKPLWSRYPQWLDYYTMCAACSGFLYGVAVALAIGWTQDLPFLGLSGRFWVTPIVVGLGSLVWTPILADLHVRALLQLGVPDPKVDPVVDTPTEG